MNDVVYSTIMIKEDNTGFFTRPITVIILALALFTTIMSVRRQNQALKQEAEQLAKLGL